MGQENPLLLLVLLGATTYIAKLWLDDLRAARAGAPERSSRLSSGRCRPSRWIMTR